MRIITQIEGDKVKVGDDVTVTILSIKDGKVRLGVDAPRDARLIHNKNRDIEIPCNKRPMSSL